MISQENINTELIPEDRDKNLISHTAMKTVMQELTLQEKQIKYIREVTTANLTTLQGTPNSSDT